MNHPRARTRVILGGLVAALAIGMVASPVLAGKGGSGKPSGGSGTAGSLRMDPMDGATEAHHGARVTFTVSTSATPYPYVHLVCRQGGSMVLEARQGFFATALGNEWFELSTPNWQSGAADCTATLEKYGRRSWEVLGTTTFHVYE